MFRDRKALDNAHAAARMIELDGVEAYHTCCERFGEAVANAVLVTYLREVYCDVQVCNVDEKGKQLVNKILEDAGLVEVQPIWLKPLEYCRLQCPGCGAVVVVGANSEPANPFTVSCQKCDGKKMKLLTEQPGE